MSTLTISSGLVDSAHNQPMGAALSVRPDLSPVSAIEVVESLHRGQGAAMTLHRKLPGQWQELGAVLVSEVRRKWPLIVEHLAVDAYFSINSTYEQKRSTKISEITSLPIYSRKAERLRWLNAAVVDIDRHHDPQFRFDVLLESFTHELALNGLPAPNFVVSSGRGLWALWPLRDLSNVHTPVPAFPERRDICQRVNRELVKKLAILGTDPNSVDAARVMRVPGSINTAAAGQNSVVQFFRWSHDAHTLPELADTLGVRARKLWLPGERTGPKNEAKVKAGYVRWRNPLEGFRRLWNIRVHFEKGVRHRALWAYALLLRKNRVPEAEIFSQCLQLAESCRPTLSVEEVRRCVAASAKAARKPFRESVSNAALGRMLEITDAEKAAMPEWFKPERQRRSTRIANRRAVIVEELRAAGKWRASRDEWVPARDMARLLAEKHGVTASHVTVLNDYRQLHRCHFHPADSSVEPSPGKFPLLVQERGVCAYQHRKLTRRRVSMHRSRVTGTASAGELSMLPPDDVTAAVDAVLLKRPPRCLAGRMVWRLPPTLAGTIPTGPDPAVPFYWACLTTCGAVHGALCSARIPPDSRVPPTT